MASELAERIRALLPKDGSTVGNLALIRRLGVSPDDYFPARAELESEGAIILGRGRGGTVRRKEATVEGEVKAPGGVRDEFDLYGPLKDWFDKFWGPDYQAPDFYVCKITGPPKGHKRKSGKWSRPDLSVVTVATSEFFIPPKTLEVTTVEVKRYSDISVVAVFEAASHGKFGHQSYVAVEWLGPEDIDKSEDPLAKALLKEARRFGVGVIQMRPENGAGWNIDERLEPDRLNPDPRDCSQFVEENFEDYARALRNAMK